MGERRRVRRRCEALVGALDIPEPFDVGELCARLGARRGRPIRLVPFAMPTDSPCGLWVSAADRDYIFFERATSPLHQTHIVLHEIGHLLCAHDAAPALDGQVSSRLLPDLDPALIERILGRTHYSAVQEQEAEIIASLILERVSARAPEPVRTVRPEDEGIVTRIENVLEQRRE